MVRQIADHRSAAKRCRLQICTSGLEPYCAYPEEPGGGFNVASHWTEIQAAGGGWNSVWKAAGYFGVGAMAGAGAAAAPVIFPALGTGALAGLASGFAGGFITGFGNTGIGGGNFGDMLTSGLKMGGMGALTGGVLGGGSALLRGKNFWSGHEIGLGRSAFAFNNSAKFAPQRVTAPNLDPGATTSELSIPNSRNQLQALPEAQNHPSNFNLGQAKYTDKVTRQMKMGDFHGFPESVKAFEETGNVVWKNSGDGIFRKWIQIPGGYKGKEGLFEFLIEPNGTINHRIFTPYK